MKIGQIFKKMVGGSMILAALACPMFTSCYDDEGLKQDLDEIKESLESLEDRVAALENRLSAEVEALQKMIGGLVTVKSAEKNGDNWVVELSDGTKFTIYPEAQIPDAPTFHEGTVTVVEVDGVKVWAVYNADGEAVPVTDAAGNNVPVVPEAEEVEVVAPQVRFNDETKAYEISFDGGQTWTVTGYAPSGETGGCTCESIFAGVELIYDEAAYEYTSAVFTLVDGYTFSVTLSPEWAVFAFYSHYVGQLDRCYFPAGVKDFELPLQCQGYTMEDYMVTLPKGWELKLTWNDNIGYWQAYLSAPSAEDIASGNAAASGQIKLLGLMAGGSSKIASMYATTNPFGTLSFNPVTEEVTILPEVGYETMFAYGIMAAADYDSEMVKMIVESNYMTGGGNFGYEYYGSAADLYGSEIEPGVPMVLWACPLIQGDWNDYIYNYEYSAGEPVSVPFMTVSVEIEATEISAVDIKVRAELKGVDKFYAGFMPAERFLNFEYSELPYLKYYDIYENDGQVYTGSILNFPEELDAEILPGNDYVYWLIIYDENKSAYTMDDVLTFEFTSEEPIPGSLAVPTFTVSKIDYSSISIALGCDSDWSIIYYTWLEEGEENRYTDADLVELLLSEDAYMLDPQNAAWTKANLNSLSQGESRILVAMVLDDNGQYGAVKKEKYTTLVATYNEEIKVAVTLDPEFPTNAGKVKFSATGGTPVSYRYWYGSTNDYYWTNQYMFGGTEKSAESFASTNSNAKYYCEDVTAVDGEATIDMSGLSIGEEYVVFALAKDADGNYSRATFVYFTPQFDLGTIVYADDADYAAVQPTVEFLQATDEEFYSYTFNVTAPAGCTAYVLAENPEYNPDKKVATRDLINYIISNSDIAETGQEYVENGDGTYDTIYTDYPHGNPNNGHGVVFEGQTVEFLNFYGSKTDLIYITWKDAAGNFHEPLQLKLQY